MRVKVVFRVNKETGEIEEFLVDDMNAEREGADHDATHDGIARRVGAVVERRAAPEQVESGTGGADEVVLFHPDAGHTEAESSTRREAEQESP